MNNIVHYYDNHFSHCSKHAIEGQPLSDKISKAKGKNVLIIEDQEIARKAHAFYLEPFQLNLTFATNAKSAFKAIENNRSPFKLILLDIGLPDINGLVLAKKLRAKGVTAPIVIASANVVSIKRQKLLQGCIQAFYVKPINEEQYENIVLEFLSE